MFLQNKFHHLLLVFFTFLLVVACSSSERSVTADQAKVEYNLLYDLPAEKLSFHNDVLPVLENRCIACHGCYDAPCQLKLSSSAGVYRGANKAKVYNGARINAADPTRLFIDAMTTAQWRNEKFTSVLYEKTDGEHNNPVRNLEQSVLYQILRLKQINPQSRTGMLNNYFDLSLDRKQSCPTINEFDDYAKEHPKGGMPYAMPNLSRKDYKTLVHWVAQGAPIEKDLPISAKAKKQVEKWEQFLNGKSNKERLFARYIYEHVFHAHLHFENTSDREFYRLVRSTTPPGEPVNVIATRRPYDGVTGDIYYRVVRHQGSIVAKQHVVYELSAKRMQRYRELFFDVDYKVDTLPAYTAEVSANAIKAFEAIPVKSRYKFLLDDARFYIEGFIKGPVCRGQIALNVIEDQFWIAFFDPDADINSSNDEFLKKNADLLAIPAELGDTYNLMAVNWHYKDLFRDYVYVREKDSLVSGTSDLSNAMNFIWDGGVEKNKNAALTIFRHFDDASVNNGWLGDFPETTWIVDYPLLERIHYLLVVGFDVYGNGGHQLSTRLYMDLLRTEGESYFLAFLPVETRKQLWDDWYQGIRKSNKDDQGDARWLNTELVTGYKTDSPQRELYRAMAKRLGTVAGDGDFINRCDGDKCERASDKHILRADLAMKEATQMDGGIVQFLPDLAFVRVIMGGKPEHDRAYTLIYNKAYTSVSNFMELENYFDGRDYKDDTQTILPWLEGAYPNFFYVVELEQIELFVEEYNAIANRIDYETFVGRIMVFAAPMKIFGNMPIGLISSIDESSRLHREYLI